MPALELISVTKSALLKAAAGREVIIHRILFLPCLFSLKGVKLVTSHTGQQFPIPMSGLIDFHLLLA